MDGSFLIQPKLATHYRINGPATHQADKKAARYFWYGAACGKGITVSKNDTRSCPHPLAGYHQMIVANWSSPIGVKLFDLKMTKKLVKHVAAIVWWQSCGGNRVMAIVWHLAQLSTV